MARWIVELARKPGKAGFMPPASYSWPVLAKRAHAVLLRAVRNSQNRE